MEERNSKSKATASDVTDIFGPMSDTRVTAILRVGATVEELEAAAAWAAGESDVMGELRRPASGPVAKVYDIISAVEEEYDERS